MPQDAVIGIIGGQGWMGHSLGVALLEQKVLSPDRLVISSRSGRGEAYRDWPEVRCVKDSRELVALADIIVLSVRPADLAGLDIETGDKLVISLLAMASLQEVASQVGSDRVVRAMPNAAAEIRRAYLPWFASPQVSDDDKRLVQALLASCGTARELPREGDLDYLTALSGAGPAYPALLAQSMLEHARSAGLSDEIAREAVMQTLVGGSLLLEKLGTDPGDMVERLIGYDGTTAKGLRTMVDEGIGQAIHRGLDAAHRAATGSR
ncbi:pyrroline-5-carboxylate reductase [Billgrantia tianxiuensis]|jgi:pyrroline-5-carboxylate reductase|uniref:Pyrroline-5-carboxylate reductase n=1 Tax=Billgrantia tianxiuensis TaxID=2497861 RepID=A0A6I6SLR4_9GAMM|nr:MULTISPECIES: pyrroline-5-carboxylate reductase dimerization domain-containing protein [Halomonas]MCE8034902.1 NAD(P)-binding domain-containing protein [Halomonas sp. MCCC 1A11057]QHC48567.1 pyrroline-5-carboxylate reductase [Halomonas tianxiuensis]